MTAWLGRLLRRWADRIDSSGKPHCLPAHTFTLESDGIHFRTDGQGAHVYYVGEGELWKALGRTGEPTKGQASAVPPPPPRPAQGQGPR